MRSTRVAGVVVSMASAGLMASSAQAQCADWIDQPPMRLHGVVRAVTSWDPDGAGLLPAWMVVAGEFERAGGEPVSNIAAWDGQGWQNLGGGIINPTTTACGRWPCTTAN